MKLLPLKYNALLFATFTSVPLALQAFSNTVDLVSVFGITTGGMVGFNVIYSLASEEWRASQYDERDMAVLDTGMAAGFLAMVFVVVGYVSYRAVGPGSVPSVEFMLMPIVGIGAFLLVSCGLELRHRLGV